jgi:2,4-dienoyl-CoA reductase-like NADH-dependent reductase (Old Yellow Enzyme family)
LSRAFDPVRIGSWDLPQRFVMAPLTRNRAGAGHAPTELNATYYAQRASAGLIITEGTAPSLVGQGYLNVPGLYTPEQVEGWSRVADRVHAEGGRIVAQLMHVGRIAHPDNKDGAATVAPSSIAAPGQMVTAEGPKDHPTPRALEADELPGVVQEYVQAARAAVTAGLDGVEVHAANGYLLHQFLDPDANRREDEYGGSPHARARFVIEVVQAVADAIGAERVGIRLSPGHQFNGIAESDPQDVAQTYRAVVDGIAPLGLAYLSILAAHGTELPSELSERFGGSVLLNDGFSDVTSLDDVERVLGRGLADAVVVGRPFLANPDLPARWRDGQETNEPDSATFYGGGEQGYTDYPTVQELRRAG